MSRESIGLVDVGGGRMEGRDPRRMTAAELAEAGHLPQPLLAAIRAKCLDCCCGEVGEVAKCTATACPLWPFRMRRNPYVTRVLSDEQKDRARERLARLRAS